MAGMWGRSVWLPRSAGIIMAGLDFQLFNLNASCWERKSVLSTSVRCPSEDVTAVGSESRESRIGGHCPPLANVETLSGW